jgi:hypothetical protein
MDRRLVGVYGKRVGQTLILRPEGPYSIDLRTRGRMAASLIEVWRGQS